MHIRVTGEDGTEVIVHLPRTDAMQELALLGEAIAALPDVMSDEKLPLLVRRAAMQSFLVDVRAMASFLAGPQGGSRRDDQFARSFSDSWTLDDETEVRDATRELVEQVNKQLAHVTTLRIGDGREVFPVDVTYSEDELRGISDQMTALYNRFATGAHMPLIGDVRPWHNEDGSLTTAADAEARFPGAPDRKHVRVTGHAVGVAPSALEPRTESPPGT